MNRSYFSVGEKIYNIHCNLFYFPIQLPSCLSGRQSANQSSHAVLFRLANDYSNTKNFPNSNLSSKRTCNHKFPTFNPRRNSLDSVLISKKPHCHQIYHIIICFGLLYRGIMLCGIYNSEPTILIAYGAT